MRCWAPFWYVFVYVEMQVFVRYVRQWIKFMYDGSASTIDHGI